MSSTTRALAIILALTGGKLLIYALLAGGGLAAALCQWDCNWYVAIATRGYDAAPHLVAGHWQANWAFFPLYPLLLRGLGFATGGDRRAIGFCLSTACFIAFALLGIRHRAATREAENIWTWPLLLTAWPYGFYFHATYTEALYAALATAGLLALARGRALAAGCASALLTAARPTGVIFAAWIAGRQFGQAARAGSVRRALPKLIPALIAPIGLLGFMLLLYVRTGDPLAFVRIQPAWHHAVRNPLAVLWEGFGTFSLKPLRVGPSYLAAWAVLGLAAACWLAAARRFAEAWLCGMTVLMALVAGTLWSMPRFVAANPAFLLAAADCLAAIRPRLLRAAIVLAMAALQAALVVAWYRGASSLV